ncbi:MAG TPA: Fe2+-dependent dioxygenase [Casimicrobiaceae bacterium]
MFHLPQILTSAEVQELRELGKRAPWVDGRATAGGSAAQQKRNQQVDETTDVGRAIGASVMRALQRNVVFAAAAVPSRVSQPMMNRYAPGMEYGPHVDNSLMGGNEPLRTDMSGTLFLSEPSDYDGGELIVESPGGRQSVKLPPGDLFLYPSTRVHYVAPVTRGERIGVVFWIQSLVRDPEQRSLLFEVSQALSVLQQERGQTPEIIRLTACYHRLVQMWAQP